MLYRFLKHDQALNSQPFSTFVGIIATRRPCLPNPRTPRPSAFHVLLPGKSFQTTKHYTEPLWIKNLQGIATTDRLQFSPLAGAAPPFSASRHSKRTQEYLQSTDNQRCLATRNTSIPSSLRAKQYHCLPVIHSQPSTRKSGQVICPLQPYLSFSLYSRESQTVLCIQATRDLVNMKILIH